MWVYWSGGCPCFTHPRPQATRTLHQQAQRAPDWTSCIGSQVLCYAWKGKKKTCFLARYFKMYTNRQHKSIQLIYSEHLRKKNTIFKFQSTCLKNLDTNWCILKPCNKKSARMILNVATMLFHAWSSWGASKDVPEEVKLGICYRPKRSMYSHFT